MDTGCVLRFSLLCPNIPSKIGRVTHRISFRVVVEIGEYIHPCAKVLPDLRRLGCEKGARVTSGVAVTMKPHINPFPRNYPRMIVDHVVNAQSGAVLFENRKHFVAEPTRIAKLNGPAVVLRCGSQEGGEPVWIRFPVGRQLHQDRSQEFAEPIRSSEKSSDGVAGLFEPHDMRAVAAELERVTEPFGSLPPPCLKGFGFRKAIKGVVNLNRVKLSGIM